MGPWIRKTSASYWPIATLSSPKLPSHSPHFETKQKNSNQCVKNMKQLSIFNPRSLPSWMTCTFTCLLDNGTALTRMGSKPRWTYSMQTLLVVANSSCEGCKHQSDHRAGHFESRFGQMPEASGRTRGGSRTLS